MKKNKALIQLITIFLISVTIHILLLFLALPKGIDILFSILLQIAGGVLVIFFFVFFHEFGHLVFGLKTGYEFISFKVGPFEWKKNDDGKLVVKRMPMTSLILGQCLMGPPKYNKKSKPKFFWYNFGGLIFSYLLVIILILMYILIPNIYIKWLILGMIFVSLFLSIDNSIFNETGVNDVCNYVHIKRNPNYLYSIMYQLEMVANITKGKRYGTKCKYKGYYEEKLNHITLPVVQFELYQAIEHEDYVKAKELQLLLIKNYHTLSFWVQRVSIIFEIMWCDLVIDESFSAFRKHFRWINGKVKDFCLKPGTDINCYYKIYESIYNKNYDISLLVEETINDDGLSIGEKLSVGKKYNILANKLRLYVENGNSFGEVV